MGENSEWTKFQTKFQKGMKKIGGRVKGTPNKATKAVKAALENTYEGLGGDAALKAFAQDRPEEFYRLWIKLLPQNLRVDAAIALTQVATIKPADAENMIKKLQERKT